jgi:hypothetical protein
MEVVIVVHTGKWNKTNEGSHEHVGPLSRDVTETELLLGKEVVEHNCKGFKADESLERWNHC